ncbi:MAG: DNA mismatch repair protein [Bacteroidetes bacterium]|nr:DNA mismatch repair protein [Bacteroidota bacterium]
MVIIGNEGIFDILRTGASSTPAGNTSSTPSCNTFSADRQTLDDLNLTGKYKPGSVFSLFNKVQTEGAERLLDEMFQQPLSDPEAINRRSLRFLYLQNKAPVFPFTREQLRQVEEYLHTGRTGSRLASAAGILRMRLMEGLVKDQRYEQLKTAVAAVITLITTCKKWFAELDRNEATPIRSWLDTAIAIVNDTRLENLSSPDTWQQIAAYHHLFGTLMEIQLHQLCSILYELDLGIAVGKIARQRGFSYAAALPRNENVLQITGLRHPGLDKAVGNSLSLSRESNLVFLTGANMAGKSTLMKSFGIAVYLAHMGFPVAAEEMYFSIRDGLYTSINVPDDLNRGHSHFYAEALRVKEAALAISAGRKLVVIFDELFKGTNVKDAYDATLAVTSTFSEYRNCFFIISTHIIEVGEALGNRNGLQFSYLPTIMEGEIPRYTYRLAAGISSDRHGMRIIENEGILDLF